MNIYYVSEKNFGRNGVSSNRSQNRLKKAEEKDVPVGAHLIEEVEHEDAAWGRFYELVTAVIY
jgi:hypothetical protein